MAIFYIVCQELKYVIVAPKPLVCVLDCPTCIIHFFCQKVRKRPKPKRPSRAHSGISRPERYALLLFAYKITQPLVYIQSPEITISWNIFQAMHDRLFWGKSQFSPEIPCMAYVILEICLQWSMQMIGPTYIGKNLTLTMTTMMLHFVEKLAMLEQYYSLGHYYWNWSVIIVRLISCSSMISFSFFFIADLLWTDRMICVNWSNCKPNSCDETAETSTTTTKSRSFKSTIEILSVCVFC